MQSLQCIRKYRSYSNSLINVSNGYINFWKNVHTMWLNNGQVFITTISLISLPLTKSIKLEMEMDIILTQNENLSVNIIQLKTEAPHHNIVQVTNNPLILLSLLVVLETGQVEIITSAMHVSCIYNTMWRKRQEEILTLFMHCPLYKLTRYRCPPCIHIVVLSDLCDTICSQRGKIPIVK